MNKINIIIKKKSYGRRIFGNLSCTLDIFDKSFTIFIHEYKN